MLTKEQQELVVNNMKLVYKLAYKYKCIKDKDLLQYGFFGLCRAAEKFNSSKGIKFSTFAYPYISNWLRGLYTDIKYRERIRTGELAFFGENSYNYIEDDYDITSELFLSELLSKAEPKTKEIIVLLYKGYTRKEISEQVNINQSGIRKLLKNLREKLINER